MRRSFITLTILTAVIVGLYYYDLYKKADTKTQGDSARIVEYPPPEPHETLIPRTYQSESEKFGFNLPAGFIYSETDTNTIKIYKDVLNLGKDPSSYILFIMIPDGQQTDEKYLSLNLEFFESFQENQSKQLKIPEDNNSQQENAGEASVDENTRGEEFLTYKRLENIEVSGFSAKYFINENAPGFEIKTKEIIILTRDPDNNIYYFGTFLSEDTRDPYYFNEEVFENFLKSVLIN